MSKILKTFISLATKNKMRVATVYSESILVRDNKLTYVSCDNLETQVTINKPDYWDIPEGVYLASDFKAIIGSECKFVGFIEIKQDKYAQIEKPILQPRIAQFTTATHFVNIHYICDVHKFPHLKSEFTNCGNDIIKQFAYALPPTKAHALYRSKNDTRIFLHGYGITNFNNTVNFSATNAHYLVSEVVTPINMSEVDDHVLPSEVCNALDAFNAEFEVLVTELENKEKAPCPPRVIRMQTKDKSILIQSKCLDGKYPDVNRVIPVEVTHFCDIDIKALKQALLAIGKPTDSMKSLTIEARSDARELILSTNQGSYALPVVSAKWTSHKAIFSYEYVLNLCKTFDGVISMHIFPDQPTRSVLFMQQDNSRKVVIMPLRT